MKILHLDSNHDMIYEELSALGIENHVDLKSTKSEIENIITNYHGIVIRSRITIDKGFIEKAKLLTLLTLETPSAIRKVM